MISGSMQSGTAIIWLVLASTGARDVGIEAARREGACRRSEPSAVEGPRQAGSELGDSSSGA